MKFFIDVANIPDGFNITTTAFESVVRKDVRIGEHLDKISKFSAQIQDNIPKTRDDLQTACSEYVFIQNIY